MIDKIKLQAELKHFTESEQIFYNPLFPKFRYTDGVKYLAQEAHCYWLLDHIFIHQHLEEIRKNHFQVWKLKVAKGDASTITVEDGNSNLIKSFKLEYTDFPLDEIDLWFIEGTLILPTEY